MALEDRVHGRREQHGGLDQQPVVPAEAVLGGLEREPRLGPARVVDERVRLDPELGGDVDEGLDGPRAVLRLRDVHAHDTHPRPGAELSLQVRGVLRGPDRGQDRVPLPGQLPQRLPPQPGRGAGDQD